MSRQILGKKGYHLVISKEKQCRSLKRTGFPRLRPACACRGRPPAGAAGTAGGSEPACGGTAVPSLRAGGGSEPRAGSRGSG